MSLFTAVQACAVAVRRGGLAERLREFKAHGVRVERRLAHGR